MEEGWEVMSELYSLEESAAWENLAPKRGQVLEVPLNYTSLELAEEIWAGLLVMQTNLTLEHEVFVDVRSLGCRDSQITKDFSSFFNRRRNSIHLCRMSPCPVECQALHVTRLKIYPLEAFHREYISASMQRQIQKWLKEEVTPVSDAEDEGAASDAAPARRGGLRRSEKKPPGDNPPSTGAERPGGEGEESRMHGMTEGKKQELRDRLEQARKKMSGGTPVGGAGRAAVLPPAEDTLEEGYLSQGYSPSPLEELRTGAELGPRPAGRLGDGREEICRKERRRQTEREAKREKISGRAKKYQDRGETRLVVSKEGTMSALQDQLVLRAAEAARVRARHRREEKKKSKKSSGLQLIKMLTDQFGKSKKRKRKDREDGRGGGSTRKKKKSDSENGDPGDSSPTSSGEGSSGGSSDEESSSDQKKSKLDPPLKKKSKEKPGSVLQMLVDHAREQLDQTSKVDVGKQAPGDPTVGVKLASYFSIVVRPQLGQSMAQMREMHMLTQAMDLLRQGQLGLAGDVLAARFMSLHQSVLDGSWGSAKYLELLPLEDISAAGPSVIMEARRHAKMAAKVQNPDLWGWGAPYKGKGGRGKSYSWQDGAGDSKGKGKKGLKGRGKGKGWGSSPQGGTEAAGARKKEAVPEK